uniref:Methyltransferase domain-containing protein n=1 Tax=Parascaris univalens TaxID=6257 RepID=A0A914ZF76_PARUN
MLPDCFPSFEKCNDLRMKVKSKKRHEIERIVHTVEILRRGTSPSFDEVLDIGAGMGHLSRQIAFCFGRSSNRLRVTTIDADEELVRKSAKLDFMLTQRRLPRRKDKTEIVEDMSIEMPGRNAFFVEPGKELNGIDQKAGNTTKCVIGVHTCGDLAVSVIQEFVADPTARVLLHFGCCYHKLNGGQDRRFIECCSDEAPSVGVIPNGKEFGFPLSDTYADFSLSYAKRELSCHAIEIFQQRLLDEQSVNDFRKQCFRSVLEWLIVEASRRKDQSRVERNIRHMRLRHVKARHLNCFWDYFKATLNDKKQLIEGINAMLEEDPLMRMEVDGMISQWRRILAIYTIRLIVAKLTETVILEDRRCCLMERGYNAHLVALFDPKISARNIALICIK